MMMHAILRLCLCLSLCLCLARFTTAWHRLPLRPICLWHPRPMDPAHTCPRLQLRGGPPITHKTQGTLLLGVVSETPHSFMAHGGLERRTTLFMARDKDLLEDGSGPDSDERATWERLQRQTRKAVDGIFSGAQAMQMLRKLMRQTTGLGPDVEEEVVEVEVMDKEDFSKALREAGVQMMNPKEIEEVFEDIDNDQDGTLTMEEMRDAYLRVHAEVYEEEEEEDDAIDHEYLAQQEVEKLLPDAPGLEVDRAMPFPSDEPAAPELLSRQWAQVCAVLMSQSEYLALEEQERVLQAVRFAGGRLLGAGEVDEEFGEGLALAGVVAALQQASPAVISAMLLPCVRSGAASLDEVREAFGPVVVSILQDVLWLRTVPEEVGLMDDDSSRVLREYIVAATRDHRAVIILLADRIQLLRKSAEEPLYQQHLRALESLQLFSPLAHALGVGKLLWELEDLAFRSLFPDSYASVEAWQLELWEQSDAMMEVAKVDILDSLNQNPYLVKVVERYAISSRRKSVFSTFKKMFRANKKREQVYDVFAMRVVIGLRAECRLDAAEQVKVCLESYRSVKAALGRWHEPKKRFKDYCSRPKANGYQSVHTTIYSPDGLPLEVQIRTEEMHAAAEFGDAAHSLYKGGIKSLSAAQRFAETVQRDHASVLMDDAELTVTDDLSEDGLSDALEDEESREDYAEETEEWSEEPGRRRVLEAWELQSMILTAPSVAPEPAEEEEEVPWSSREIGTDLIYTRPRSTEQGGEGGVEGAAMAAREEPWEGVRSELPLQKSLRELKQDASEEAWQAARAVSGGAEELAVLRQMGASMLNRQERIRAMLDAESARLFDPDDAVLGTDLPPQLGPLGAGTVSLVRSDRDR